MNTPKMLPWLANTSGIELERAEQLWNSATSYAQSLTGETDSAKFLALAHEHMVTLVENELLSKNPVENAPWLMIQAHISVAPLIVADTFAQAATATRQALHRWSEKHAA